MSEAEDKDDENDVIPEDFTTIREATDEGFAAREEAPRVREEVRAYYGRIINKKITIGKKSKTRRTRRSKAKKTVKKKTTKSRRKEPRRH